MPRDKKKNDNNSESNWMTTYGDMMTLLLCFFVLLYSFSNVDADKFQMMMDGLQGKLGVLTGGKTISQSSLIDTGLDSTRPSSRDFNDIYTRIEQYLQQSGLENEINLEMTDRGLTIRFTGKVLFDLGEADIKNSAYSILDKMAGFVKGVPHEVIVEGHTDNWPISNDKFPSNWELSTTRATNVIRYFIENNSVNPERLSAAGYAEYKPLAPNDTEDNRAINRRVDMIISKIDEEGVISNE